MSSRRRSKSKSRSKNSRRSKSLKKLQKKAFKLRVELGEMTGVGWDPLYTFDVHSKKKLKEEIQWTKKQIREEVREGFKRPSSRVLKRSIRELLKYK